MNESEIFLAAAQIEDPQIRATFVHSVCNSTEMANRIFEMFADYEKWEGGFEQFADSLTSRIAELPLENDSSVSQPVDSNPVHRTWVPGTMFATYEIIAPIGSGGMGDVFLANDPRLGRRIALKILPAKYSFDSRWITRFHREAKAASALNHPNILTVYEIGHVNDQHFIATEFIEGRTLRSRILDNSLTLKQKLEIGIQIANALQAAHNVHVMHRDIKPENIMIRKDGLVKVLDFGIAKLVPPLVGTNNSDHPNDQVKTEPGMKIGTIRYMSPEQARGSDMDYRTDIFSFGIVLFELFSGRLPFSGNNDLEVVSAILQRSPVALSSLVPDVPHGLDVLVARMLEKRAADRNVTAQNVADELRVLVQRMHQVALFSDFEKTQEFHLTHSTERPSATDSLRIDPKGTWDWTHAEKTKTPASDTQFEEPEVRYALSGQVNIAYQVLGRGDFDIVFVMGWVSHLEWFWKEPSFARFLSRLASFSRLILFDKRGTGLSDRVPHDELPTLEQRMDDVRAVMSAVGSDKAVLLGISEGGPMCSLFAATYPEKTIALAMIGSYARRLKDHDYPWGPTPEEHLLFLEDIRRNWGGPVGIQARAPSRADDPAFRAWWATYLRMGASPGAVLALTKMNSQIDVRPILSAIQVPTIVIHRRGDRCLRFEEGEFLANSIPGASFVALDGDDHLPFVGEQEEILQPLESFLRGVTHNRHIKRVLVTVLYAEPARELNTRDDSRIELSMTHAIRDVELFRGRAFTNATGTVTASFDGPARAIRAAIAIRNSSMRLGIHLRLGLHTGECEISEDRIGGPGVETARRIAAIGNARDVLVSKTVKDLIAGSEIQFSSFATSDDISESEWANAVFSVDG